MAEYFIKVKEKQDTMATRGSGSHTAKAVHKVRMSPQYPNAWILACVPLAEGGGEVWRMPALKTLKSHASIGAL